MNGPLALAVAAVAVGCVVQAVTGFGFSLVSAPFLIAFAAAPRGVAINLLLSCVLNTALLVRERRGIRWRALGLLLLPALVVTPLVASLARWADRRVLTMLAGALILALTALLWRGVRLHRARGAGGAMAAGAVSAAMNVVAGVGGPPVVLYGLNAGWDPVASRPTLQLYFLGINLVGLVALGVPAVPLSLPIALLAGVAGGAVLADRLPVAGVRRATFALSAAGGVLAISRGAGWL